VYGRLYNIETNAPFRASLIAIKSKQRSQLVFITEYVYRLEIHDWLGVADILYFLKNNPLVERISR